VVNLVLLGPIQSRALVKITGSPPLSMALSGSGNKRFRPTLPFFLKTPNIFFSVMQKPFKKCVFLMEVTWFLRSRKKLIRRFQKKLNKLLHKVKIMIKKHICNNFRLFLYSRNVGSLGSNDPWNGEK
jgi:hypothetical protein